MVVRCDRDAFRHRNYFLRITALFSERFAHVSPPFMSRKHESYPRSPDLDLPATGSEMLLVLRLVHDLGILRMTNVDLIYCDASYKGVVFI